MPKQSCSRRMLKEHRNVYKQKIDPEQWRSSPLTFSIGGRAFFCDVGQPEAILFCIYALQENTCYCSGDP